MGLDHHLLGSPHTFHIVSFLCTLVGLEAEKCQACIHQVKEDIQSKRGELAIKNTKLSNQEVEVQVHSIRKEILTNQRDTMLQENRTASKKAVSKINMCKLVT